MTPTPTGIYRGWFVLAACFFSAMLVIGGTIYIYQLFVIPVTEELGISRGSASNAFVGLLIGIALWSPLIGRLYDKVSVKLLMPLGGLAYAAGLAVLALSSSPVIMLVSVPLLLGLAMALAGGLAANTITARWFERRRGRALGIASIASSAGGFLMIPLTTALIEGMGWRDALLTTGLAIGAIIVLTGLLLVNDRPQRTYAVNAGEFAEASAGGAIPQPNWTFASLLGSRQFWLITIAVGLLLASDQAVLTTQFPFFLDIGFTTAEAASIATGMTGSAIAGKLLVGFLAERYDIRWLYIVVALFHAALLAMFLLQPGYLAMLIFVSIFGAAVGGIYPVWSVLVSQNFGAASFGVAFGAMALFTQALAIGFVAYINRAFDASGSYSGAYTMFLGAIALGIVAIALLRRAPATPETAS